jgi:hypothetical protein
VILLGLSLIVNRPHPFSCPDVLTRHSTIPRSLSNIYLIVMMSVIDWLLGDQPVSDLIADLRDLDSYAREPRPVVRSEN